MGGTQRLAAVAAVSHHRNYNYTQPEVVYTDNTQYGINVFFISATLCGVLVAVCAACWPRSPQLDKPEEVTCGRVYTISEDDARPRTATQLCEEPPGPPPAYDSVVVDTQCLKDFPLLQEVITEPNHHALVPPNRPDSGLPSYEAALMIRDTKL